MKFLFANLLNFARALSFYFYMQNVCMKKNAKKINYSCIPLCFCAGVAFFIVISINHIVCINLFSITAVAFFFTLFNSFVFKSFGRVLFAVLAGMLFGVLRTERINQDRINATSYLGKQHEVVVTVSSTPTIKNNAWRFESNSLLIDGKKQQFSAYISLPKGDYTLEQGDKLILRATPSAGFGKYTLFFSRPELLEISKPDPPSFFQQLRSRFSKKLEQLFGAQSKDELALALGYLTGDKSYLSEDLSTELKIVGLSHVVVASGFHLGIIIELAKKSFGKLSRFGAVFASAIAIIVFVSVTGLSASILRAALISGLNLFVWYFGRKFHPARLLLFAAAISLTFNPLYALDIAWQLSFASFAGLLLLAPLLQEFFYGTKKPSFIASTFIQSAAAQLCCLPLSIYSFGSFSLIGLISNLLIPSTIPLIMLLSLLCVLFAPISGLNDLLVLATKALLGSHVWIIKKLSSFKFGYISLESNNKLALLLFLVPMTLFIFLKLRTKFDFRPLFIRPPLLEKSRKNGKIYSC